MPSPTHAQIETVQAAFSRQSALQTVGARLACIGSGTITLELATTDHILQQNGFIHGGVLSMVADAACGMAVMTVAPPDSSVLTIEFKINFFAPARVGPFTIVGKVEKLGGKVAVCSASITDALADANALMIATMSVRSKSLN